MHIRSVWRCALTAVVVLSSVLTGRSLSAGTVWPYDFGSGTGTFTSGESTSFLPTPSADGGTARVRIGSGGGQFALVNPGSGNSSLVGTASSNTSVNKFSIYDFAGTGLFTLRAELTFSGGDSGSWQLFLGNGATFSNNSTFNGVETFTGLRWDYDASDGLEMSRRADGSSSWLVSSLPDVSQQTTYTFAIYGNNTATATAYKGGTLSPGTWDLWLDGSLVSAGLPKASLPDGTAIDSLMFNGASSGGNAATLTIGSLAYTNAVPEPHGWTQALIAAGGLVVAAAARRFQRG